MGRLSTALLTVVLGLGFAGAAEPDDLLARGDAAWARRAQGHNDGRPAAGPISDALAAYEAALAARPDDLAARWRLMRALYFQGEFVASDPDAKLAVFARGRDLAEEGLDQLAVGLGGREVLDDLEPVEAARRLEPEPQAAAVHFWAAAHWGLWGRHRGKIAAARQGVANKIRRYAEVTIALDERFENAGGHRILGRLHAEAPKIPFFTGWVDRPFAILELERAVALAPDDLLSQLYLAEALIDYDAERRVEGIELLRRIVASQPNPDWLVEEIRAIADARARLEALGAAGSS
jgi:tetratricopeptide (TPR) repeat protein